MKISVIIPTIPSRNILLQRAIYSIKNQTHKDIELIVVDEGKPPVEQRNIGLLKASGDCIAFLDDDDFWTDNNKLKKQLSLIKKGVSFVGCGYYDESIGRNRLPTAKGDITSKLLMSFCNIETSTTLIRKEVIELAGLADTKFQSEQNHEYFYRISKLCKFDYVPEIMVYKSSDDVRQISVNSKKKIQGYIMFHQKNHKDIKQLSIRNKTKLYPKFCAVLFLLSVSYLLNRNITFIKKLDEWKNEL